MIKQCDVRKLSEFKFGDWCTNHLLSFTHDIYISPDVVFKVTTLFLDISKAFEKGWQFSRIPDM